MRSARAFLVAVALLASACRTAVTTPVAAPQSQNVIADRLFFGRNIPGGGTVSDADWQEFLRTVITPRFPKGLTVWHGDGQWLDPRGDLVREVTYVVEVEHENSAEVEAAIAAIAAEYKKQFHQDAVLRITSPSTMRFY